MQKIQETWVRSLGWEDPLEEENGYTLQYSRLEKPMDRGAWRATVHGVAKSWTRLSNFTSHTKKDFHYNAEYLPQGSKLH